MLIPYGKHYIDRKDVKSVSKALRAPFITQGPLIDKFEREVCKYVNVKYAVAVNSCTAGLQIALQATKIKEKKIITSPVSFVSTANSILFNNLTPIFSDINSQNLNLEVIKLKEALKKNKNIKAIIPVHLGGLASNSYELFRIAKKRGLFIIEDAAHSFGGTYKDGSKVGSCKYSHMTVFSFHPVKTITTGEGGVVTTNSKTLYERLKILRNHGIQKNSSNFENKNLAFSKNKINPWYYEMIELGYNYRITDIQCALGLSQLKKLKKIIEKRRKIALYYDKKFSEFKNITPLQTDGRSKSSNHLYIINVNFKKIKLNKSQLMDKLKKIGISTQVHYIPIPLHPYYKKKGYGVKKISNSLKYYNDSLSIPIHYNLKAKELKKIVDALRKLTDNN